MFKLRFRKQELGNKNIIGKKVSEIRKSNGLKQKDFLAKLQVTGIDLSASGLSKLEGQTRFVTDKELLAIADTLNIPTDLLLGRVKKRTRRIK